MAKSRSVLELQGTFQGKTFVNSKAYGNYVRAARGTYKHAEVNGAFRQESTRLLKANVPAKIIKDAIDPYRMHFKGGMLWQRLVSQFRKQLHASSTITFSKLEPVEVHERYPLTRLITIKVHVQQVADKNMLRIKLTYSQPRFRKASYIDGYQLGIIAIYPDLQQRNAETAEVNTPIMKMARNAQSLILALPVPDTASEFVLCLTLTGCEKEMLNTSSLSNRGMRIVAAGVIERQNSSDSTR